MNVCMFACIEYATPLQCILKTELCTENFICNHYLYRHSHVRMHIIIIYWIKNMLNNSLCNISTYQNKSQHTWSASLGIISIMT